MKTAIIVYSQTGNTLSVGERLAGALRGAGHDAALLRIVAADRNPQSKGPVVLLESPDASAYDFVIFGAPVQAFSLSPVMKAYMAQAKRLTGKRVGCFVTQHFKRPWMGGNQAVGRLARDVGALGGMPVHTGIVNWSSGARDEQIGRFITEMTEKVSAASGSIGDAR